MRSRLVTAVVAIAGAVAMIAPAAAAPPPQAAVHDESFRIEVLSSAPDQVTGGDALVRVHVPRTVPPHQATVRRNGVDITRTLDLDASARTLTGLVDGLRLGDNTLAVEANGNGRGRPSSSLTLRNHPISGPVFSGPQQQPFVCTTARNGLGQPIIDNTDAAKPMGIPVAREAADGSYPRDGRGYPTAAAEIIGWSKDCAAPTRVDYRYRTTGGGWATWTPGTTPTNLATTTMLDGTTVPYLVRWERGTNNRFISSVATLLDPATMQPRWNKRMLFSLQGGVAIGRTQGAASESAQLLEPALAKGYAVLNSTGLRTNTHYNLQLGGETALMLKEHAIETLGVPDYTLAVGGSGGAIQQYVYAQNHPGLIDAAVPQYSYPDMVTQTIHVGDCELLEHYMDVTAADRSRWRDPARRQLLQGLNVTTNPQNWSAGNRTQFNGIAQAYQAFGIPLIPSTNPQLLSGQGECRKGWFGLLPLAMNPTFTNVDDLDKLAQGTAGVEWTHWADLVNVYGTDASGFARVPWDNVGVQYGLEGFRSGDLTVAEFLDVNAKVGGWKGSAEQQPEGWPFNGQPAPAPTTFDPWSSRNTLPAAGGVRPRRSGDLVGANRAYSSGMVFRGDIDIPIIDYRPYLEHELDMHNTHQSFAVRQRMLDADGDAGNLVVWFSDARPQGYADMTMHAFDVIDRWMANISANPTRSVAENRPAEAVDTCFNQDGSVRAAGGGVWAGILDDGPDGACTQTLPVHSTSRIEAGAPINGDVFACQRKPVATALADGTYGSRAAELAPHAATLQAIFPTGVCDHSKPDAGRP